MTSFRGKLFINAFKLLNVNPEKNQDQINSIKKLEKLSRFKAPKGYEHLKINHEGLPIEIIKKQAHESKNVIYILHGGAYIAKLNALYLKLGKGYSIAGYDANIVYIDYRVAPEHKYPAALEDAIKGWDWLLAQGYKEDNIIVIGDSAGGHLTLSLLLKLRELKRKMPKAAVCMSPWADMTGLGKSYVENYNNDPIFGHKREQLTEDKREKFMNCDTYSFCKDEDRFNPYISPVYAEYNDFPPMFISVGSHELLLSDSLTIADKLTKAGVEVDLDITEGMFHVFPLFGNKMPESKRAMNLIYDFIGKHLSK